MWTKALIGVGVACLVTGCCTSKKAPAEAQVEAAAPGVGPDESHPFPLQIEISENGSNTGDDCVSVRVEMKPDNRLPNPRLEMTALNGTDLTRDESRDSEAMAAIADGKPAETEVRLCGEQPGVEVRVIMGDSIEGGSFGMMVKSQWPPIKMKNRADEPVMSDLPAAIEIEGVMVDRGVEVHP